MHRVRCPICEKEFASKDSLRKHIKKQHPGGFRSQTGKGPTIAIVPKSNENIANKNLDNDEAERKDRKREFNDGVDPSPYRSKDPRSIKCRLCSKKVISKRDLAIHMEEQHPTCLYCRKRFPTKREFEKHHHPTCHICNKVVLTEKALNEHLKIHPKCHHCGEIFLNETQLKIHMLNGHKVEQHPTDGDLDSDSTMTATKEVIPLDDDSIGIDRHSDGLSDKDDISLLSVDDSILSGDKDDVPMDDTVSLLSIDMQSDGGDSNSTLSASKDLVPLENDVNEIVPYEARTYEVSSDRSSVKTISGDESDDLKICPICFRRFIFQEELDAHLAEHVLETRRRKEKRLSSTKRKKKPWEKLSCHLCDKKFLSQKLLDKHIDLEHSHPGPMIKCPNCHRKFESKRVLDNHIRDKHNSGKKHDSGRKKHGNPHKDHYVCHYCGKHFESQEMLDNHTPKHRALDLPKPAEDVYECQVCNRVLKTKEGYLEHIRNHRPNCTVCAAHFKTTEERDIHMSLEHPRCMLCDIPFATLEDYMQHKLNVHPEDRAYDGPPLPSETEDELDTDEDSIDGEDRQFHKHIDCVSIEKFLEIHELIELNQFDTLASDTELLAGLQVIFKGVLKGYIPLCSPQRLILTKAMKKLLYNFGSDPSAGLLMRNKKHLKQLFTVLWDSVKLVIDNYMKYAKK